MPTLSTTVTAREARSPRTIGIVRICLEESKSILSRCLPKRTVVTPRPYGTEASSTQAGRLSVIT